MLKQRVITAIVLIAGVLAVILWFPPLWFAAAMGLAVLVGGWEWTALAGLKASWQRLLYLLVLLLGMGLLYRQQAGQRQLLLLAGALWWVFAFVLVRRYPKLGPWWSQSWLLSLVGLLVLLPGYSALLVLRSAEQYVALILLLLVLVAAADIGAYFTGRALGKHKLAPQVSPNKTWEGFLGGMLLSCLIAMSVLLLSVPGVSLQQGLLVLLAAMAVAAISVVGDLFESMIKRQAGVKDSGTLLPGHGGVLDRIDSITAALPLFTLALNLVPLP